jgi:FdrA protein
MSEVVRVEPGRYHDSVTLMRASAAASAEPGVEAVIAAMATPLNQDLLRDAGFPPPAAGPDDLVVAVRAVDESAVDAALAAVERVLAERRRSSPAGAARVPPHTVEAAAAERTDAGVVVVSVPGPYAYVEAAAALRAGRHVMVFSDGVDLDAEVALKREGAARGRLVMGPDCGTVILAGVGLGFANVVVPGPVGLVAASGTGAQQLCGLLDGAGIGVRHVLGVGGRDLSASVGGLSALGRPGRPRCRPAGRGHRRGVQAPGARGGRRPGRGGRRVRHAGGAGPGRSRLPDAHRCRGRGRSHAGPPVP